MPTTRLQAERLKESNMASNEETTSIQSAVLDNIVQKLDRIILDRQEDKNKIRELEQQNQKYLEMYECYELEKNEGRNRQAKVETKSAEAEERFLVNAENKLPMMNNSPSLPTNLIKAPQLFSGTQDIKLVHPVLFISELEEYFENFSFSEQNKLLVARQSLIGPAKLWESVFRQTIKSFEQFKNEFIEEYWNTRRQQKYKVEFYSGQYEKRKGVSNMADYFLQQVSFARLFRPVMNDEIIIDCILRHFPADIEWGLRSNIKSLSINGVKELLRQRDEIESRANNESNRAGSRPPNYNGSTQRSYFNIKRESNNTTQENFRENWRQGSLENRQNNSSGNQYDHRNRVNIRSIHCENEDKVLGNNQNESELVQHRETGGTQASDSNCNRLYNYSEN